MTSTTENDRAKKAVMWLNKKGHARRLFKDSPRGLHLRLGLFIFGVVVCGLVCLIVLGTAYGSEIDTFFSHWRTQLGLVIGLTLVCAGFGVWALWFRKR